MKRCVNGLLQGKFKAFQGIPAGIILLSRTAQFSTETASQGPWEHFLIS